MMENWADDDPLVLDQTGKLLPSAIWILFYMYNEGLFIF